MYNYHPNPNPNNDYPNPSPNAYYPNANSNYNEHNQNPNPNKKCSCIFVAVFCTLITAGAREPKSPEFSVSRFEVSDFDLSSNSFTSDFNLSIAVRNPNKKSSIRYDEVHVAVLYNTVNIKSVIDTNDDLIAETSVAPFNQSARVVTNLEASCAVGVYTDDDIVSAIRSEQSKGGGAVTFGVRFISVVKFKAGAWRTRRHYLRVYCDDIRVGLKNLTAGAGGG
ncbi:NDR1/HIN1-like protein 10, partial [Asparagus officinalis]|uniref:NDR1/HIN1-like protein 10 n=1 Tax=Asparagus officinalis TaxID=4686 RepID=UPI00098E617D